MHSRLFQIVQTPIEKEDYMSEYEILDGTDFVPSVADYISDDNNREEDIKEFIESIKELPIEYDEQEQTIIFKKGFKAKYFEPKLEELKKKVKALTLEDFSTSGLVSYSLSTLIKGGIGCYIYNEDFNPMTLDAFFRDIEEEKKYYFGGVLDYHF